MKKSNLKSSGINAEEIDEFEIKNIRGHKLGNYLKKNYSASQLLKASRDK
mgnify:CR=1 FL=1|jgi:hypothetical protein